MLIKVTCICSIYIILYVKIIQLKTNPWIIYSLSMAKQPLNILLWKFSNLGQNWKHALLSCFSHVWLFYDPMNCSLPGSSVHGIFQASILEWVAISFSRESPWPRDWTWVSSLKTDSFTTEPPRKPHIDVQLFQGHLLKRLAFSTELPLHIFLKIQMLRYVKI